MTTMTELSELDQLLESTDEMMAKLSAAETDEAPLTFSGDDGEPMKIITVILSAVKDDSCVEAVQKEVEKYTTLGPSAARAVLGSLPIMIPFEIREQAETAVKTITDAGGTAAIGTLEDLASLL